MDEPDVEAPLPLICASCGREVPGEGMAVCPFCDDVLPDPGPSYRDLRRAVRGLRGWVVLSFLFGLVVAPFAIYRITRALVRFRHVAPDDPVSYRELVVLRRMAVGLLLLWSLLAAGYAGLEIRGSTSEPEALVLDATFTRMLHECSCPNERIYLYTEGVSGAAIARLSEGRDVVLVDSPAPEPGGRRIQVNLFAPRFRSEILAEVPGQLRNGRSGSFGATYTVQRDGKGVWKVLHRELWWNT